jgi:hypothetical protein
MRGLIGVVEGRKEGVVEGDAPVEREGVGVIDADAPGLEKERVLVKETR